jgi:hypothetical protein
MRLTGGCQCGAVRFAVTATPLLVCVCHCRMCQKASGGAFMAFARVPADALSWTRGAPCLFRSSSFAERGFCAGCGTPLTYQYTERAISLTVGSFDRPELIRPGIQFGIVSRLPWIDELSSLPGQVSSALVVSDAGEPLVDHQHPDHDT